MKRLNKIDSIGLAFAGAIASGMIAPLGAFAAPIKDTAGNVYISGYAPGAAASVTFTSVTQTKSVTTNSCGAFSLKPTATVPLPNLITIGTTDIDLTTLPTQLKPTCTAGTWDIAPTGDFKTSTGEVVLIGRTPNTVFTVSYSGGAAKSGSANACGIFKVSKSSNFTPTGNFTTSLEPSTIYSVSSILEKPADICRNGVRYVATP